MSSSSKDDAAFNLVIIIRAKHVIYTKGCHLFLAIHLLTKEDLGGHFLGGVGREGGRGNVTDFDRALRFGCLGSDGRVCRFLLVLLLSNGSVEF